MISTRDLRELPDIRGFRRLTRALATLGAILSPEWEYRYYSFNSNWAEGEMMASMRNGSGDQWFALLSSAGVLFTASRMNLRYSGGFAVAGHFRFAPERIPRKFLK